MKSEKLEGKRLCSSCQKYKEQCIEVSMGNFVTSPKGIFCNDCGIELIDQLEIAIYGYSK